MDPIPLVTARPLADLVEAEDNPRTITDDAFDRLCYSLESDPSMLLVRRVIRDARKDHGDVVAGNMRVRAARRVVEDNPDGNLARFLAATEWPVLVTDPDTGDVVQAMAPKQVGMPCDDKVFRDDNERREWMLRDNAGYGEWQQDELAALLAEHQADEGDMALLGFDQAEVDDLLNMAVEATGGGDGAGGPPLNASLAERFVLPPFTVLDARRGEWRDRKRGWLEGYRIKSELGRDLQGIHHARSSEHVQDPRFYEAKREKEQELGRELTSAEFLADHWQDSRGQQEGGLAAATASIFDPVLCELVYRWFSPERGTILDPFAGGSVRGIVAAALGRDYVGVDLSADQVTANQAQLDELQAHAEDGLSGGATWIEGDARDVASITTDAYDLLFSCPPYHDLEVYSDDPRDLSRCGDYEAFRRAHARVIDEAVQLLADDRFACWVIGDVRDKKGRQLPLVADTIRAFENAGASFYNEAILVQPVGSLRIRVARQFVASRKLGRTHQQLLVFCKGDPKRATEACGEVDADALQDATDLAAQDDPDA
jgi:DNA modification methylase